MLKVYESSESVCCQKVRIVLAEKSIDHTIESVSLDIGEQNSPAFLAINPRGMVPVIDHDGRIVTESTIIVEYLDEAFAGDTLMPDAPYWRARRRQWARWIDDGLHLPHIAVLSFNIAFTELRKDARLGHGKVLPPMLSAGLDSQPVRAALSAYTEFLHTMNRSLAEHPWLAGPRYSLADIDVVPYIWRLNNLQLHRLWDNKPHVAEWFDRVVQRSSFQAAIVAATVPHYRDGMRTLGEAAWPKIESVLATL